MAGIAELPAKLCGKPGAVRRATEKEALRQGRGLRRCHSARQGMRLGQGSGQEAIEIGNRLVESWSTGGIALRLKRAGGKWQAPGSLADAKIDAARRQSL